MDDVAAGVVDDAPVVEEAAAPEGEGADGVGEGEPEGYEEHPRLDVHAPEEGAGEEDEGDGREDALEVDHGGHGVIGRGHARLHGAVVVVVGGGRQLRLLDEELLAQRRLGLSPEGQQLVSERHVVGPCDPTDPDGGEGVERHEGRVHRPLLLHDAPVEDDQPRHALHADQRGGYHLPCVVAFVEPVGHGQRRVPLSKE
ncbi:hypothetical protein C4D60_Mb05t27720 [Musa balbisiana]|uniref:Uncharacterized protein n=1 Tax=Musa balbisiana TaxID=52838 RepID=A0A4S8JZF2_MUSBA|nr:hypothetical protein C4D60_Mb05t27720 [Musa balbisiana]